MLVRMEIHHEPDERPLEPCAGGPHHSEAGPGELARPLEVEDPEPGSEVPMSRGLEAGGLGLAPDVHDRVVVRGCAARRRLVRQIRHPHKPPFELALDRRLPLLELLDLGAELLELGSALGELWRCLVGAGHGLAGRVTGRGLALGLGDDATALGRENGNRVERGRRFDRPQKQRSSNRFQLVDDSA
jgi:hypothetical protein